MTRYKHNRTLIEYTTQSRKNLAPTPYNAYKMLMFSLNNKRHKLRRNLYLLPANEFFAELCLYYPVTILAYQAITGSFTQAMAVFALINIVQAALEVPTGVLSDKKGRRFTFITGASCELVGALLFAAAFFLPYGPWYLFTGGALFGAARALFSGNYYAIIYETLSYFRRTDELPRFLGRTHSMGQIALAIAGGLASLLLWLGLDYKHLVLITLLPITLSFICALFTVEPPQHIMKESNAWQHMKDAARLLIKNPELRGLAIADVLHKGLGEVSHSFAPGFIASVWPLWLVPLFRMAQNAISAPCFWFAGSILKRFGLTQTLFTGSAYSDVVTFLAYIMANVFSPLLLLLTRPAYALTTTANASLQQKRFSDEQRSTMGSLIAFLGSILGGIGALFTGIIADYFGPAQALTVLLLLGTPSIAIYYRLNKSN